MREEEDPGAARAAGRMQEDRFGRQLGSQFKKTESEGP